jgi:hypothetical protein
MKRHAAISWGLSFGLIIGLAAVPAPASFHLIDVNEVFTNADGSVQYVELIARDNNQTNLTPTRVTALNKDGSVTNLVFNFTSSFNQLNKNETILIATPDFESVAGFAPDFVTPAGSLIFYPDGRVVFRQDSGSIIDAVAYGEYTGDNSGFGDPAAALPCDGVNSLNRSGTGNDNESNWSIGTNSPTRNDGTTTTLNLVESDCNGNGIDDLCEINLGDAPDCNGNRTPDECESDRDGDGAIDDCDGCPDDPNKIEPGVCGCGVPDTDSDGDTVPDCIDKCPGGDDRVDSDGDGIPDDCDTEPVRGDSNCDGGVDFNDIDCYVAALIGEDSWNACGRDEGCDYLGVNDINGDGSVDFNDIDPFVECIVNSGCP